MFRLAETLMQFFCDELIGKKLLHVTNSPMGNFSSRIDSCAALGLIDDFEYAECHLIRKIRNAFAHSLHGLRFNDPLVSKLCVKLKSDFPSGIQSPSARSLFTNAVICITA